MSRYKRPDSYYTAVKTAEVSHKNFSVADDDFRFNSDDEDRVEAVYKPTTVLSEEGKGEPATPEEVDNINFRVVRVRPGPQTETFVRRFSNRLTGAREKSAKFREDFLAVVPVCCKRNFYVISYLILSLIILFSLVVLGFGVGKLFNCGKQKWLPIYMIGAAIIGLIFAVANIGTLIVNANLATLRFQGLLFLVNACWQITGLIFLGITKSSAEITCDQSVITLATITIVTSWIIMLIVLIVVFCCFLYIMFRL